MLQSIASHFNLSDVGSLPHVLPESVDVFMITVSSLSLSRSGSDSIGAGVGARDLPEHMFLPQQRATTCTDPVSVLYRRDGVRIRVQLLTSAFEKTRLGVAEASQLRNTHNTHAIAERAAERSHIFDFSRVWLTEHRF